MDNPPSVTTLIVSFHGQELGLTIFNNPNCLQVTRGILAGHIYPRIGFLQDVRSIVDVGANVGAASLYFALTYPEANLFAFEPCPETCDLLRRNLAPFSRVHVFDFGLFDRDCHTPLYLGSVNPGTNSVGASQLNTSQSVQVSLRDAGTVLAEQGIGAIDILKIDTEGCELPILRSLADRVAHTRVLYLEYHDEADRRAIDDLLCATHILCSARLLHPHRGELCYVAYSSFPSREELDRLRIRLGPA